MSWWKRIVYVSSFDTSRDAAALKAFVQSFCECFWSNLPTRPIFPLDGFDIYALMALMFVGKRILFKIDL
jgi:hypothetical protein